VEVPRSLVDGEWDAARVLREKNSEVRRVAIEHMGWGRFIAESGMVPCAGPVADPGNPGRTLTLYDIPDVVYRRKVRVLLCTNGSPDRSGAERVYGLTVDGSIADPVEAAARSYRVSREEYLQLGRRT
jgi:hypothetical protein